MNAPGVSSTNAAQPGQPPHGGRPARPRVPASQDPPPGLPAGEPTIYQAGKLRWLARRTLAPAKLSEVLEDPDKFLAPPVHLLVNTELITLGVVPPLEPGAAPLLLRRLNYGRIRHRLRDIFRPTRAERAFRHGLALERAAVATPRVLAVGVQRCLRWPVRAYLITEYVPDSVTLLRYLLRDRGVPRALGDRLADLVARLHSQGFSHLDLSASNLLFDRGQQPCVVDLDGIRNHGQLPQQRAVLDLARLAEELVLRDIHLDWNPDRFLIRYCRQRGMADALRPLRQAVLRELQRLPSEPGRPGRSQRAGDARQGLRQRSSAEDRQRRRR